MTKHRSDSSEQALGEKSLLVALEDVLGIRFDTGRPNCLSMALSQMQLV